MSAWWEKYKVDVPEGKSGDWAISRFEITKKQEEMYVLRSLFHRVNRAVDAGIYTKLTFNNAIIMSDTKPEIKDHIDFINKAKGNVLIHGLGLGMVARACLIKLEVLSVTIVEIEEDVIKLVSPWLHENAQNSGVRLEIINGDAYTYKIPQKIRWDVVWHDIWPDICGDNYDGMKRLHRRFGKKCDFQDSWCRNLVKKLRD